MGVVCRCRLGNWRHSPKQSTTSYKMGKYVHRLDMDLGYEHHEWGALSIRKRCCDALVKAVGDTVAAQALQHTSVNSQVMNQMYKKSVHDRDLGFAQIAEAVSMPMDDGRSLCKFTEVIRSNKKSHTGGEHCVKRTSI